MKFINLNINNYIAIIEINNESQLNALNQKVLLELDTVISKLENDKSVKILIITGAGKKAFVAGADIKEMQKMSKEEAYNYSKLGNKLFAMQPCSISTAIQSKYEVDNISETSAHPICCQVPTDGIPD